MEKIVASFLQTSILEPLLGYLERTHNIQINRNETFEKVFGGATNVIQTLIPTTGPKFEVPKTTVKKANSSSSAEKPKCPFILVLGARKGEACGKPCVAGKLGCTPHSSKITVPSGPSGVVVSTTVPVASVPAVESGKCSYVFQRGQNKDNACGAKCAVGSSYCTKHKTQVVKKSAEKITSTVNEIQLKKDIVLLPPPTTSVAEVEKDEDYEEVKDGPNKGKFTCFDGKYLAEYSEEGDQHVVVSRVDGTKLSIEDKKELEENGYTFEE